MSERSTAHPELSDGASAETLRSFRIFSLLGSSAPLRFNAVGSEHGEILKRRGKEEQRKN